MAPDHFEILAMARRAVDACGGTFAPEQEDSGYADGYRAALRSAEASLWELEGAVSNLAQTLGRSVRDFVKLHT